jgi:hypothetical protein
MNKTQQIAQAWVDYTIRNRISGTKTYQRAQADFLTGVFACMESYGMEPPATLMVYAMSGRDIAALIPKEVTNPTTCE